MMNRINIRTLNSSHTLAPTHTQTRYCNTKKSLTKYVLYHFIQSAAIMSSSLSPPFKGIFASYEELLSSVQNHAWANGYAIVVSHSRGKGGQIRARYLQCVKSGKTRDRVIDRKKPLISQKTECPFKCKA